ncbi:aminotransferase class V-fold PLP-dependent enzyme [Actinoplanes sp. TBRC 11911]|uniref:aminotransferase class V-fold PLP-dependent enzyme n=1 Tax=Actinoplanes sp. TBRC 11911 TaxID=2729386 RepID=UPI00145C4103|nr:aminotransferase class V-fold PLP-dependent enzyme [Actinoplanes sp. TBRC 11911]NMO52540.1 aminotransferase class V-fold PLP-dependent enzyme [Actinoplanes sp. TBRC 11911]
MSALEPPTPLPGARLLFSLDPGVAYLNHGTVGVVPIGVQRAQQRLRDEVEANPRRFYGQEMAERVIHTRRFLAGFLGADPDGSALVPNITAAVSIALNSVPLGAGDEVLVTDHVYGAVEIAVRHRSERAGASVRTVALPADAGDAEVVALVVAALRPGRTKLLVVDQLASVTAKVFPVREMVAAAHERGIPVLVDAAHVPGMLPVDVTAIDADFWAGTLHKWAFAPRGTALLAVGAAWRSRIEPLAVGWSQDQGFPRSVEHQGTLDYTPWLAAPTGLFTLRTLGWEAVRAHNAALAAYGQRVVAAALDVELPKDAQLPEPGSADAAMRVVPLPPGVAATQPEAYALRQRIAEKLGTEVAVNAWGGRGLLRLSAQVYNRADEYERLAQRLPELLAER